MKFHGLFVGIDHYASEFTSLRFAQRDATVLGALFDDNLEGESTLLLDGDATKEKIVTEMRHLAQVSTDEHFVVITFSGHGVTGGALATYDTLPDRLAETSLSLDDLAELARGIRARALLLVLDCCFSGHAADKVLRIPQDNYTSRDGSVSATNRLDELRKAGYVVISAAGRDQEAFEEPNFRHGLLSHYLIQGLLGHPEAVDDGRIYILKLAHYVFKNVSSHKMSLPPKVQDPVLGSNVSSIDLKIFKPGPHYLSTADAKRPQPATAEIASLAAYEIPAPIVKAWQDSIQKLNRLQIAAINEGALLEGMNVLVSAPTSTGKTMVGELSAMRAVAEGKKAVFLLPTRALVNEQYERFQALYGPLGIRTIRVTGELRDQMADLINNRFELAVLTYEKFIGLLSKRPDLLSVGVLVIDEIQSLTLPERGPLLETLLTWLRIRDGSAVTPQIVGLSAVLGKPDELARWLRANLVTGTRRDVPLLEGVLGPDGCYRYRDQEGHESSKQMLEPESTTEPDTDDRWMTRLVSGLVADGQQVIVFRGTRGQARTLARSLARTLGLPAADTTLEALSGEDGGRTTDLLRTCLQGGVAFHMADLTTDERRLLEQSFGRPNSEVRVLVATTTLAQGVNLPADSVVICELEHPSTDGRPYSVSEYKNMAGRAGRVGMVEQGRAIIRARGSADADQKWQQYVQAKPEEVRSALLDPSTDVRTVILAALAEPAALAHPRSGPDIERFMAATFASHQSRVGGSADPFPSAEVRRVVGELVATGFLEGTPKGPEELPSGLAFTDLGRLAVHSGLGVDSVTAVAEALAAVPADRINRATLICAAQLTSELNDVRFNQVPKSAYREQASLAKRLSDRGAAEQVLSRLMRALPRSGVGLGHARRSIACLMWTEGIRLADIERAISDPAKTTRPEIPGPVQHVVQRTADVIATVIEIVFLGLARAGLTSPADILGADPEHLLDCVGGDLGQRRVVREAAVAAQEEAGEVGLRDLLPPSED